MKKKVLAKSLIVLTILALVFAGLPVLAGEADVYAASFAKPGKVKSLKVSLTSSNYVKLKWSKTSGKAVKGYAIYRNGKLLKRVSSSETSYTDKKALPGKTYKYYVKAYNKKKSLRWYNKSTKKYQTKMPAKKYRGERKKVNIFKYGRRSPERKIKTTFNKPSQVKGLKVTQTSSGNVKLTWTKVKKDTKGYAIYRNGKRIARVGKSKTSYTDKTVKNNKTYKYYVKAYNKTKAKRWYNKKTKKYQKKKPAKKYRGKRKNVNVYKYGKKSATKSILVCDYKYKTNSDGTLTLTKYRGKGGKVVIPSKLGGKKVTKIGSSCFRGNAYVTSVEMPSSITSIGNYAFEACSSMTAVKFSSMLKSIGKGAFSGDAQLKEVKIPKSVDTIGDGAFLYCMGATKLTVEGKIKNLGQFAFAGMESIRTRGSDCVVEWNSNRAPPAKSLRGTT